MKNKAYIAKVITKSGAFNTVHVDAFNNKAAKKRIMQYHKDVIKITSCRLEKKSDSNWWDD
jgi:hypothetical protein